MYILFPLLDENSGYILANSKLLGMRYTARDGAHFFK